MATLRRLTVVCHQFPPWQAGGLAEYADRFLYRLREQHPDLAITLFTLNYPGEEPHHCVRDGITVRRPRMPRWLKNRLLRPGPARRYFGLALLLFNLQVTASLLTGRRRDTVLAVHDWQTTPTGILATLLLRLPVVYHVQNTEQTMTANPEVEDPFGIIGLCQRVMSVLARRIVVLTPELRDLVVRYGWPPRGIRIVANGHENPREPIRLLPTGAEQRALRRELLHAAGFPTDSRLLVFAGRLSRVKGILRLLEAMPAIAAEHPDVRLLVLGVGLSGTDQDRVVDDLLVDLDLHDRVHVYHRYLPYDQVQRHYQAADVCVFPSSYEPFGLVSVEAMAVGAPVVLGTGFSTTIASDGQEPTAVRLASDDVVELARQINALLADPARAAALGRRGRRYVCRAFTWSACVASTLTVYREALGAGQPALGRDGGRALPGVGP